MDTVPPEIRQVIISHFDYFEPARWRLAAVSREWRESVADHNARHPLTEAAVVEAIVRRAAPEPVIIAHAAAVLGSSPDAAAHELVTRWIDMVPLSIVALVALNDLVLPYDKFIQLVAEQPGHALMMQSATAVQYYTHSQLSWISLHSYRKYADDMIESKLLPIDQKTQVWVRAFRATLFIVFAMGASTPSNVRGLLREACLLKEQARIALTPEYVALIINMSIAQSDHQSIYLITAVSQHLNLTARDINLFPAMSSPVATAVRRYRLGIANAEEIIDTLIYGD